MSVDDVAQAWSGRLGAPLPLPAQALLAALPAEAVQVLRDALAASEPSTRDRLTGLLVRTVFDESVHHEVASAARHGAPTLLVADLDGLTGWMQERGHLAGDLLLQRLAEILRQSSRRSDVLGRVGVDQLALLLPRTDLARGMVVARRVLSRALADLRLAERDRPGTKGSYPRLSIGVGFLAEPRAAEQLLHVTEAAVERARRQGGRAIEHSTAADLVVDVRESAAV